MFLFFLGFHFILLVELFLLFSFLLHLEVHVILLRDFSGDSFPLNQINLILFFLLIEIPINSPDVISVLDQHIIIPLVEVSAVIGPLVKVVDGDAVDVSAFYACDCHNFFEDVHPADYYLGGLVRLLFELVELTVTLEKPYEDEVLLYLLGY